jgi:hypothetical protein
MKRLRLPILLVVVASALAAVAASTPAAAADSSYYLSGLSWKSATNGWGAVEKDRSNGELGSADGRTITLNGATYAKGLGAHAYSDIRYALGQVCTSFDAFVGVDDEISSTKGSIVFQVYGDGAKLYDSGLMTGATATKTVSLQVTGVSELRLVITDGGNGKYYDHGDWADARVTCSAAPGTTAPAPAPADTTPPVVSSISPASGATGVAVTAPVTASFSEALNAATVNGSTMTLVRQGGSTPVAAAVTYDSTTKTVRLTPSAALENSVTYAATVKGGTAGVKDVAGNAMTTDRVWSFTTVAASSAGSTTPPPTTPPPAGQPKFNLAGWGDPVPAGAAIRSDSVQLVQGLMVEGQFGVLLNNYTVAVYQATGSEPRRDSYFQASWSKGKRLTNVPYSASYVPSPGSDHHVVVVDGGCQYEYWGWSPVLAPGQGVALDLGTGWTTEIGVTAGNASGLGGLIFPDELEAAARAHTSLPHALAFAVPYGSQYGRRGYWSVAPSRATADETVAGAPGEIPMGAHLILDRSLNVETLPVDEYEKVILRTLQTYGAYARDGGGFFFYAADVKSFGGISYAAGGNRWKSGTNVYLSRAAVPYLRFLEWGAPVQTHAAMRNSSETCAQSPIR